MIRPLETIVVLITIALAIYGLASLMQDLLVWMGRA